MEISKKQLSSFTEKELKKRMVDILETKAKDKSNRAFAIPIKIKCDFAIPRYYRDNYSDRSVLRDVEIPSIWNVKAPKNSNEETKHLSKTYTIAKMHYSNNTKKRQISFLKNTLEIGSKIIYIVEALNDDTLLVGVVKERMGLRSDKGADFLEESKDLDISEYVKTYETFVEYCTLGFTIVSMGESPKHYINRKNTIDGGETNINNISITKSSRGLFYQQEIGWIRGQDNMIEIVKINDLDKKVFEETGLKKAIEYVRENKRHKTFSNLIPRLFTAVSIKKNTSAIEKLFKGDFFLIAITCLKELEESVNKNLLVHSQEEMLEKITGEYSSYSSNKIIRLVDLFEQKLEDILGVPKSLWGLLRNNNWYTTFAIRVYTNLYYLSKGEHQINGERVKEVAEKIVRVAAIEENEDVEGDLSFFYNDLLTELLEVFVGAPERTKNIVEILEYIDTVYYTQALGYKTALPIYKDYINMLNSLQKLKRQAKISNKIELERQIKRTLKNYQTYPKSLKLSHDLLVRDFSKYSKIITSVSIKETKEKAEKFLVENEKFKIILPETSEEILKEGRLMSNCVGGYVDRVAKGSTYIGFVREKDSVDKPYATIEFFPKKGVRQYYLKHNREVTDPLALDLAEKLNKELKK